MNKGTKNALGCVATIVIGGALLYGAVRGVYALSKNDEEQFEKQEKKEIAEENARINEYFDTYKDITGTVIDEAYGVDILKSFGRVSSSSSGLFSSSSSSADIETVKLDPHYVIKIKKDDGKIIAVNVIDNAYQTKEALDMLVSKGTRVSFPGGNQYVSDRGNGHHYLDDINAFSCKECDSEFDDDTQFGSKEAGRIRVLNPSEK